MMSHVTQFLSLSALPFAKWASSSVSTLCPSPSWAALDSSLTVSGWRQLSRTSQLHTQLAANRDGVPPSSSSTFWDASSHCLSLNQPFCPGRWVALIGLDLSITFSFLIYNNVGGLVMFQALHHPLHALPPLMLTNGVQVSY